MNRTAELAKYGLLDVDDTPTNNDFDPTPADPDDYGDPFNLFDGDPHDGPHHVHPDMVGYLCSKGFLHTETGLIIPKKRAP